MDTFHRLPESKRMRIVEAAMSEFASHSFDRANLDRIASAAGVPKGSLYQYFRDKRACFDATVAHAFGVAFAEFAAHMRRSRAADCFEEFRQALLFPLTLVRREPLIARLYYRVGFLAAGDLQGEILARNSLFQGDWFDRGIASNSLDPDIDRTSAGFLLDAIANRVHFLILSGALPAGPARKLAKTQTDYVRAALARRK